MNDWLALTAITAAINPIAAAANFPNRVATSRTLALAAIVALLTYGAIAAAAHQFLNALSVEPATFDVAAGIIVAASGASVLFLGPHQYPATGEAWQTALAPLAIPLLVNPAGAAAAIVVATRTSTGLAVLGAVAAIALGLVLVSASVGRHRTLSDAASRLLAAVAITIAAGFAVDGIRSI